MNGTLVDSRILSSDGNGAWCMVHGAYSLMEHIIKMHCFYTSYLLLFYLFCYIIKDADCDAYCTNESSINTSSGTPISENISKKKSKCLKKCCLANEYMSALEEYNDTIICEAKSDDSNITNPNLGNSSILISVGLKCEENEIMILFQKSSDGYYKITEDYDIWRYENLYPNEKFCVDNLPDGDEMVRLCAVLDEPKPEFYQILAIIGVPFLLATFIVYALMKERTLHMNALMNYVAAFFFDILLSIIGERANPHFTIFCVIIGYAEYFFAMASYFWMNVICTNIWLTFSAYFGMNVSKVHKKRQFLYCFVYAWGMPTLCTIILLAIDTYLTDPIFDPNVGQTKCSLAGGITDIVYLHGPISGLMVINVLLFVSIGWKIHSIKKQTSVLRSDENQKCFRNKQDFYIYLRLLFATGINWSTQSIAAILQIYFRQLTKVYLKYLWYVPHGCNSAYGILIFFMFVFKKNIWIQLKTRFKGDERKPLKQQPLPQNASRSTSVATAKSNTGSSENINSDNKVSLAP